MADTPKKQNAYFKIYSTANVYLGTIDGAINDWRIIQELNTPVSELSITIMTEPISLLENDLVIHYNKVQVWVDTPTSPSGVIKFIGYIDSYDQDFDAGTLTFNLHSYGKFLDSTIYESGSNTTITHTSVDLAVIIKASLDNHVLQGGKIAYTSGTIPTTGISISYTFNTASVLEVINKCLEIAGDDFYWYIDLTTNYLHFKEFNYTTINHHLGFGKSIIGLKSDKSLMTASNTVYFTGGNTGGVTNLFKKYTSAVNKNLQAGLPIAIRLQDERVTTDATAEAMSNAKLNIGSVFSISDEVVLAGDFSSSKGYPIDTISLGQTAYVTNIESRGIPKYDIALFDVDRFDYDISDIGSQLEAIRYIEYTPDRVKLIRGRLRTNPNGITRENGLDIKKIYTKDNPTAPS